MTRFFYLWLPIIFGCHCKTERSFFYKGKQFPICARCTGELIGIILGIIGIFFWTPSIWFLFFCLMPMLIDGSIQALTSYTSNNWKRLLTGIVFGYGIATLLLLSLIFAFQSGYQFSN